VSIGLLNKVLSEGLFSTMVVAPVECPKRHSPSAKDFDRARLNP
jgi:hypothetical protein